MHCGRWWHPRREEINSGPGCPIPPRTPPTQGYVVGNYQMDFNIAFNVTTTKTGGTVATSETLTVNPSVPIVRSADKTVTASLLGDLASYSQIPNLANHYLMVILDSLSDTPSVAFSKNKETWMLLDPALVDPAGLTCDKVGITYS